MNINLYILQDHLPELSLQGRLSSPSCRRRLKQAAFYDPAASLREDLLYLARAEDLAQLPRDCGKLSFLCLGAPDPSACRNAEYLFTLRPITLYDLMNRVLDLQSRLSDWEDAMRVAASEGDLQSVGSFSLPFFDNPIALYAGNAVLTAYFEQTIPGKPKLFSPEDLGNHVTEEENLIFLCDPTHPRTFALSDPSVYEAEGLAYRILFYNLRVDGVFYGRLCLFDTLHSFRSSDYALIMLLGKYLTQALLVRGDTHPDTHYSGFTDTIYNLLSGQPITQEQQNALTQNLNWTEEDLFFCCRIVPLIPGVTRHFYTVCNQLSHRCPDSAAVIYHDCILFLAKLEPGGHSRETILGAICPTLRDSLMKMGISTEFLGIGSLHQYFAQADLALRIGSETDPSVWHYRFEHYALSYLLQPQDRDMDARTLCHGGLLRLMDHDRRHNKDYSGVLYALLRNDRNIAKTSREIYVQRPTLLYQINRIQEILQADLDDYMTRLYLMLSFELLRREQPAGSGSRKER